jgi:uncharacterized protein (TIGR03435 family)
VRVTVAILAVTGTFGSAFCLAQSTPLPGLAAQPQSSQTTAALLEFEAASIKPYKDSGGGGRTGEIGGGGLRFTPGMVVSGPTGVTARAIILTIYNLAEFQLTGGPAWLDSDRFDLQAKAGNNADRDHLKLMLQTLMGERFGLTIRRETKEMSIYALVMGKNGPGLNLHELKEGEPSPDVKMGGGRVPLLTYKGSMEDIARGLAGARGLDRALALDRPVRDKTGLSGNYLLYVPWPQDEDFKTTVQDQSGLRFEIQKAPMDVIVIDQIHQPIEN